MLLYRIIFVSIIYWIGPATTQAQPFPPSPDQAVYQYAVQTGDRRAYLWIPPTCKRVRGVIMSLANLLERNWLEDPIIRQTSSDEGLGIIWLGPGRNSPLTADMKSGAGDAFQQMMDEFAQVSGYSELKFAPLIPMGHSANGQFAWAFPNWKAERTIAAIPVKTVPLPATLNFANVPLCYVVGETTEWPQFRVPDPATKPGDRDFFWPVVRESALALRAASEANLVGVVTDPGGGHFDWSERQARFIALFIRKACHYRLPKNPPKEGPIPLQPIAPEAGWLTDTGGMEPDRFAPAPYRKYAGDRKKAYWFFDEETAKAAVAFNGDRRPRQRQMLTFVQHTVPLPVAKQGFAPLSFEPITDNPAGDALTFRLRGEFLTEIPRELIGAGNPLGHAPGPIQFRVITGPVVQTGPATFRIQFNRGNPGGDVWIQAEHPGNDQYRHAVQPGQMKIPAKLTTGKPQTITFPAIGDQPSKRKTIPLTATSDSGLPVSFYVVAGPAVVEGNTLQISQIPVKSKSPIKVTLVAYQWGRTQEPTCQSAEPVEQSFLIYTKK